MPQRLAGKEKIIPDAAYWLSWTQPEFKDTNDSKIKLRDCNVINCDNKDIDNKKWLGHLKTEHGYTARLKQKVPGSGKNDKACRLCDKVVDWSRWRSHYQHCHPQILAYMDKQGLQRDEEDKLPLEMQRDKHTMRRRRKHVHRTVSTEEEGKAASTHASTNDAAHSYTPNAESILEDSTKAQHCLNTAITSNASMKDDRRTYVGSLTAARAEGIKVLDTLLTSYNGSMQNSSAYRLLCELKSCTVVAPMIMEEYKDAVEAGDDSQDNRFLFLGPEQAHSLLRSNDFRNPFKVPARPLGEKRHQDTAEDYVKGITSFHTVYVQDVSMLESQPCQDSSEGPSQEKEDMVGWSLVTVELPDWKARLLQPDNPMRLLDLQSTRQNPIPHFLVDLPGYGILAALKEQSLSMNIANLQRRDLSLYTVSRGFESKGAFSTKHIEGHGVIQSVQIEHGRMIWLTWPRMDQELFKDWVKTKQLKSKPSLILLEAGDVLVQPAGTVYASLALESTLMTRCSFWNSVDMARTMQLCRLEFSHPFISKSVTKMELRGKMKGIKNLWEANSEAFPWSSRENLEEFREHYEAWVDDM